MRLYSKYFRTLIKNIAYRFIFNYFNIRLFSNFLFRIFDVSFVHASYNHSEIVGLFHVTCSTSVTDDDVACNFSTNTSSLQQSGVGQVVRRHSRQFLRVATPRLLSRPTRRLFSRYRRDEVLLRRLLRPSGRRLLSRLLLRM